MRKRTIITGVLLLSVVTLLLGACAPVPSLTPNPQTPSRTPSSTVTTAPEGETSGNIQVYVTDAPPREEVSSIMVTVAEVQVHLARAEQAQERETEQESADSENQTREQEA